MPNLLTANVIREQFIQYFQDKGHEFVPSSSLVPGGDQTLLFTNAGMVQFKDIFLGKEKPHSRRVVNSQKCMRVAGKHNDLDDVGRDDIHHTFFEMLGNWSFGDYYKKEAINWAWDLLTNVWGIEKDKLWVTCFQDEKNEIPSDNEAAGFWRQQSGINPNHILFFGRKENFWEMADTGPCGPCSEIHIDRGEANCEKRTEPGHVCMVNGNCSRFLELWNLVFIQYNRMDENNLQPLPETHVDTGMGLERIVSTLQNVKSNYLTDLLFPIIQVVQELTGLSDSERDINITPYRVIADHGRAATFLIADGVVPGNLGRNYICRMIIRRAARFGEQVGLKEPFLSGVAEKVIELYGDAYPELKKNKKAILLNLTKEEERFQSTLDNGLLVIEEIIQSMKEKGNNTLGGKEAFNLYATHGIPLEITRDVMRERGFEVDQDGFFQAMEEHRISSGAGKAIGHMGGEDAEFYNDILTEFVANQELSEVGVDHNPYSVNQQKVKVLAIVRDGQTVEKLNENEEAAIIIDKSNFYVESGGQVSDTGIIKSLNDQWEFKVIDVKRPVSGIILHIGRMEKGTGKLKDEALAEVDMQRRMDIMRNHTATHLLQAKLRQILGEHVRQAGSLVAPDHLRFDFTHPEALTKNQLNEVQNAVNYEILNNYQLRVANKPIAEAMKEGATALFGEKYGNEVRTIKIGDETTLSYELCGGTHVSETGEIGTFIIQSESSAAAGIRRIIAITGRNAYKQIHEWQTTLETISNKLECSQEEINETMEKIIQNNKTLSIKVAEFGYESALMKYHDAKNRTTKFNGLEIFVLELTQSSMEIMRQIGDLFIKETPSGIAVITNLDEDLKIQIVTAVTENLVKEGYHAGAIAKNIAIRIGGSGGGKPHMAQAGGTDQEKLKAVLPNFDEYIKK